VTGERSTRTFVIAAGAVVTAAIVAGLIAIGSPDAARVRQLDARRVADLQGLQRSIDVVWARAERLPRTLDEISAAFELPAAGRDPEDGRPYGYRVLSEKTYELCAEFREPSPAPEARAAGDFWSHGAGPQCFQFEAKRALP
jgi:hypothetical protein